MKLLLVAAVAAVLASAALAAAGDPRKQHTAVGQLTARKALLKLADLGPGWTGAPAKPVSGSKVCRGFRPNQSDLVETGYAVTPDYSRGENASVAQWARTFATPAQAADSWNRTVTIALVDCLARQLKALSTVKSPVTIVGQYRLPVPRVGQQAAGFRVVASIKDAQGSFRVYADIVVVRQGSALSTATLTGFLQPIDPLTEERVARAIAARLGGKAPTA